MYSVEWEDAAREQVRALPAEALAPFAEVVTLLQVGPWSGRPLRSENPDANILTHDFGDYGIAEYLVVEDQRRVLVLSVIWIG